MEIHTLIVDDEPLALDVLETYVQQVPDLVLVGKCANALEAGSVLNDHHVDLVLLDIQMPQLTGVEFVRSLQNPPYIIFTTAFPNYAIEGFELDAVDYLLKPISLERFLKAINRVRDLMAKRDRLTLPEDTADFIFVKADKKYVRVKYDSILYIEGLKDYVIIRLIEGRVITLQTMKSLEERLPAAKFRRIHRSYIVNIDQVQAISGNIIELMEGGRLKTLPIGKNYRDELTDLIEENKL